MKYALLVFLGTWLSVFTLGLQSLNVNQGHYLAAAVTSLGIGAGHVLLYKYMPTADWLELGGYFIGGVTGITASMWFHRRAKATLSLWILAALKKLGPTSPGTLEDHLGASHAGLGRHLKEMLDAGTIKAAGVTKSRRLALPDQDFADKPAPPQRRKPKKHAKRGQRKAAQKAPHAPAPPRRSPRPSASSPRSTPPRA
jgi:hypothetical protein